MPMPLCNVLVHNTRNICCLEPFQLFDDSSVTPVCPMQVVDESRLWSTKTVEGLVSNQVGTAIYKDRQLAAREIASGRMIKFHMLNILSASRPAQRIVFVISCKD